jgi:predicted 2-oxoglutarate/Fe(II)-dependent dioxygenase YbiX
MNILDYVTVENLMSKEFCKDFLKLTDKQEWKKHRWTYSNEPFKEQSHKEKELDIQSTTVEMQNVLNPYIQRATEIYMDKFHEDGLVNSGNKDERIWIVSEFTSPRLNKYEVGTKMRKHYDHIHSCFEDRKGIPVISLVGVFNDDYEGGKFMLRDTEYVLKTGDILIMPSVFLYPHEVTEITKGTRYSFVAWAF